MDKTINQFLSSFSFSSSTRVTYRSVLILLVDQPGLHRFSAYDLLKFVDRPSWGNSKQYVSLVACRKYLAWRFGQGHHALSARIKRIRPKHQRSLTTKQALELLASFDTSRPKGARDLAIAALALDTGLRLAELCRLSIPDLDLEKRTLQVIVKGGQWSCAVFSPETAQYIREWLAFRCAAQDVKTVFISTRSGQQLTRGGLRIIVYKWGTLLGIKLSPHDLRRSFATLATIFGAPSHIVQVAGRWSDISMVEHYTQDLDQVAITPYLPVSRLIR